MDEASGAAAVGAAVRSGWSHGREKCEEASCLNGLGGESAACHHWEETTSL